MKNIPIKRDENIATNCHYVPIIGLEVHVELKTLSKMFCGCSADYFGHEPNTHCCPVCLGLPGALPVPNKKAIEFCIKTGLALNCEIPEFSMFDRKNYFYPDLPKGYQISQYKNPLCIKGIIKLQDPSSNKKLSIRINRVHMEEDTGKLIHAEEGTLIDFNRSGVPLVEIVTEPDIRSAAEAKIYVQKLQQIIRYLDISDADMEKGSMRLEPSISMKLQDSSSNNKSDDELPNYRVEVKNINSFRFLEKAINFEIERQTKILDEGGTISQETRGWNEGKMCTLPQRSKEEAKDYRYFPEPDIPPMRWDKATILKLEAQIPELPDTKLERFIKEYGLSEYDAGILVASVQMANYFEETIKKLPITNDQLPITPKVIANWIINRKVDINNTKPQDLIVLITQSKNVTVITDNELEAVIKRVIEANGSAVLEYKAGKEQALMFLVGQVMKETKGQGEVLKIKEIIKKSI